jgi:hypothetical protein
VKTPDEIDRIAEWIARRIMADVLDRRDIKHMFAQIRDEDPQVYEEILAAWSDIVRSVLRPDAGV